MKYIIAHDLGTSGNKATLFREDGQMVTSETFAYGCHYFNANWAEQDPEDWWRAICETSRNLIAKANIDASEIAAISFSGQMMGCLCVDRAGCFYGTVDEFLSSPAGKRFGGERA